MPAADAVDVFITAPNADRAGATPVATALANRTALPEKFFTADAGAGGTPLRTFILTDQ